MKLSEKLIDRLKKEFDILAEIKLYRTYAGYLQRSKGAWKWYVSGGHKEIGSCYTMKECFRAKKWNISKPYFFCFEITPEMNSNVLKDCNPDPPSGGSGLCDNNRWMSLYRILGDMNIIKDELKQASLINLKIYLADVLKKEVDEFATRLLIQGRIKEIPIEFVQINFMQIADLIFDKLKIENAEEK